MAELSPMMKQYFEIKEKNKDSILFFRLGDFYEMFFDDAKLASRELDLTLTGRDCGQKRELLCVVFHFIVAKAILQDLSKKATRWQYVNKQKTLQKLKAL